MESPPFAGISTNWYLSADAYESHFIVAYGTVSASKPVLILSLLIIGRNKRDIVLSSSLQLANDPIPVTTANSSNIYLNIFFIIVIHYLYGDSTVPSTIFIPAPV